MALPFRGFGLKRNGSAATPYDRVINVCLWLVVFLVPWFFLPVTTDPLEFNKAMLFYLLVLVAGVTWLLKFVIKREGSFLRTPYDVPLAVFVIVSLLAAVFSVSHYRSFVGISGYVSGTFVSLAFFVLFFLLIVNTVRREHLSRLLNAFLLSGAVVVIYGFLQVFSFFILPWDFSKLASFNGVTVSPVTFAIYLAIVVALAVYRFLALRNHAERRPLERGLTGLLALVGFFLLMVYDQPFGWLALLLGLLLFLVFLTAFAKRYPPIFLILPTVLIGLSLIGLFVDLQTLLRASLPGDIILPPAAGWPVTLKVMTANPILGFGQETFQAVFAKFRPPLFNDMPIWDLRFLKSSNEWFQQVASVGVLGTLALLVIVVLHVRMIFRSALHTSADDPVWWQRLSFLAGGLVLILAMFVIPFNFLLAFLFWLFLGLGFVGAREKEPAPAKARTPGTSFTASLSFSLAVVLGIVFLYFAGRFWFADQNVARAQQGVNRREELSAIQNRLTAALELNPHEQSTYFDLAQNLLVQAQLKAQEEKPDLDQIRALITTSIAAGQSGADRFKSYAGSYEALSRLYLDIDSLTGTTSEATLKAFTTATELEPNNPELWVNLGQYHLLAARQNNTQPEGASGDAAATPTAEAMASLEAAKTAFEEAAKKKTNYIEANLNVALTLRLLGRGGEAVKMLEDMTAANPFSTDTLFNLGENYIIDSRDDDALATFERVTKLFPGHSDAHFRLAQIHERRGEMQLAIDEYEIVQRLNPDNEDVKKKLTELKESPAAE